MLTTICSFIIFRCSQTGGSSFRPDITHIGGSYVNRWCSVLPTSSTGREDSTGTTSGPVKPCWSSRYPDVHRVEESARTPSDSCDTLTISASAASKERSLNNYGNDDDINPFVVTHGYCTVTLVVYK